MLKNIQTWLILILSGILCTACNQAEVETAVETTFESGCHFFVVIGKSTCIKCEYSLYSLLTNENLKGIEFHLVYDKARQMIMEPLAEYEGLDKMDVNEFMKYGILDDQPEKNIGKPVLFMTVDNEIVYRKTVGEVINHGEIARLAGSCL